MSWLDPVQVAALKFATGKLGVGWFAEQGLGKTLMALYEFAMLYDQRKVDRMVVVCPNTFKQGWVDEIQKHKLKFDSHIWESSKKDAAVNWMNASHDKPVLIINYEAIRMPNVLAAIRIWASRGNAYLAIDESIQIKSPPNKSQRTKAVHALAAWSRYTHEPQGVRYVRLLTGRPQTQGPHDLWAQMQAIGAFLETNFYAFRGHFCIMESRKYGDKSFPTVIGAKNTETLARAMEPIVFQAKKADWLPLLPRKDFTIREYQMSGDQKRQYNQMEKQFLLELESGVVTVEVAIAKYAKLAQIQCGFIYDEGVTHQLVAPEANPRLNLLKQLLDEEVSGKCCIVYRHRAVLPFLVDALQEYRPAWISGGMTPDETSVQKVRFNETPECRIILLQCDAAKYGHTLLGGEAEEDKCRTMIFFENSYSADTRDQIEDRIHRRGQTGEYVLYVDLSGSDLDRRIVRALQRKDDLYRSVFKQLRSAAPTASDTIERVTL